VGIQKASVYHHVPTKGALARAVVARYRATVRGRLAGITHATSDPPDQLARYVGLYRALLQ